MFRLINVHELVLKMNVENMHGEKIKTVRTFLLHRVPKKEMCEPRLSEVVTVGASSLRLLTL